MDNHLLEFIDDLGDEEEYLFQKDNASIHTVRVTTKWKRNNDIETLLWPAQSSDMNPIENLWDELERQVQARKSLPKNWEELWSILQKKWGKIKIHKLQNLVNSMPNRIKAVLNSKGNPTKY